MTDPLDHMRAMRLLPALSAQLLSDDSEAAVRAHVAECTECQAALEELSALPDDPHEGPSHIPSSVLAAWPRVVRELRGLERELVANHLKRCEECRGALSVLGYEPSLSTEIARTRGRWRSTAAPRRRELVLGAWAALATAAAIAVAVVPSWRLRDEINANQPPPPELGVEARGSFERAVSLMLAGPLRSAGDAPVVAQADSLTNVLVLEVPSQAFRHGEVESVLIELCDPQGKVVSSTSEAPAVFDRPHILVIRARGRSWEHGEYVLRLRATPTSTALVRESIERTYPFHLKR